MIDDFLHYTTSKRKHLTYYHETVKQTIVQSVEKFKFLWKDQTLKYITKSQYLVHIWVLRIHHISVKQLSNGQQVNVLTEFLEVLVFLRLIVTAR